MQTCLEIYSIQGTTNLPYGRHQQEMRSDYQRKNTYDASKPDALAPTYSGGAGRVHSGDGHTYTMGKGTGSAGHGHWLPNCTGTLGMFNYSNFNTDPSYGAGNEEDNAARNTAFTRSLYNKEHSYCEIGVDTSVNVSEGQFVLR